MVYHQSTTQLEAEGNLQVAGGPNDVLINADHGDMRLNMHTARFFNVHGSQGIRTIGHAKVYSTAVPFTFAGRVVLELSEGHYKIIDGSMTNCRLPKPDWKIISRAIELQDGKASTTNALFKFFGVPLFYLPYLSHPVDETGRSSGILIPAGENSGVKGLVIGEQVYWVISRNMDMIVGAEYWSKRGWAPNGDFRYRGAGLNHATVRWNALLDRGVEQTIGTTTTLLNQGGVDINAEGRMDLDAETRLAGKVEYLSSYIYRLVFNDNYSLATTSEVQSDFIADPRAQLVCSLHPCGALPDLCGHIKHHQRGFRQRQPGQDSSSAFSAHRPAGPTAGRDAALWGPGIFAWLSDPLRACRTVNRDQLSRPQRRPHRLLSASCFTAHRRRLECAGRGGAARDCVHDQPDT